MSQNKYFVNSLYISNFKPFRFMNPPKKVFFTDASKGIIKFMMLSGFNGYGKTSIFQAIEFALNGRIEIFDFKDTTNKYTEHMIINELNKESLVALELFNEQTKKYLSIIRYNSKVTPCKESDCREEYKDFNLYVMNEEFDYKRFIDRKDSKEISTPSTKELARILGENDIDEWLKTNYIKQEQSSNILFKSNSERVNFVNQFIDKGCEQYFVKFEQEKVKIDKEISDLKKTVKQLIDNIANKQVNSIGQEPEKISLFNQSNIFWDKEQYNQDEDFELYIQKLDSLHKFSKNVKIYDVADRLNKTNELLKQSRSLKEIIIYSYFENLMDSYVDDYQKKIYLEELSIDKNAVLTYKINNQHVPDALIEKINNMRTNSISMEKLSNNKQKMYNQVKSLREYVLTNTDTFVSVFDDTCPLCGHAFSDQELTLKKAVINYSNLFKEYKSILDDSLNTLSQSVASDYHILKGEINEVIKVLPDDKDIYDYICNIKKDVERYKKYKEILAFLLDEDFIKSHKATYLNSDSLENIFKMIYNKLQLIRQEYEELFEKSLKADFDESIYQENESFLPLLRKIETSELEAKIQAKKMHLQWRLAKKQFDNYSKDQSDLKENINKIRDLLIRYAKLEKLLACVKKSKELYMSDIIGYIEIPLYIYSGKLLQTHQNGLGIFCTTGPSEEKVTQFMLGDKFFFSKSLGMRQFRLQ